ncbi:MAG: SIS domain-containing protein [Chthoniobacterales bacterium]|nr:SIS domain-containing protein [Chthoniobacterales bacterium]
MSETSPPLRDSVAAGIATLQSLVELEQPINAAAEALARCLCAGHKLLVCGNGGSAADAAHFATEFVVRFTTDRPAFPAVCLTSDGGTLTAAGNDYGFDEIFARQVAAFGQRGDVLLCLTTSGNSRNIQRALEEAKTRGLSTIALLGRDGGATAGMADIELLVRSDSTARIQEAHMFLLHVLCEAIEERLAQHEPAPRKANS